MYQPKTTMPQIDQHWALYYIAKGQLPAFQYHEINNVAMPK
jgi:hypothetical protein